MKKSISIWSFYGNWTLAEKMRLAKDAGFAGLEVELAATGPISLESTAAAHRDVVATARETGIQLSGLATGLYWAHNGASADTAAQARARDVLEKQLRAAHALGVDAVLVIPGSVGADFVPDMPPVRYDHVWERATALIADALPLAQQLGVTLCVENVWNKFLLSPLEMARFVDQFKSERVGCYFDVGNTLAHGYPEHWIEILGPRIRRVHFKDFRRAVGTIDGFVDLLSGDVNWPAVVKALRSVGYDGWVAAEMIPPVPFYKHCPEVLIANTHRALERILALG